MKKLLLSGLAALTASGAFAADPSIVENAQIQGFTPDGQFFVSIWGGELNIYKTATGELVESYGSEELPYSIGHGNFISPHNTIVGATPYAAAYLKNGKWTELDVPSLDFNSYAQGITPDEKLIVGMAGLVPFSTDDTEIPMQVPVYWELQADGTYSEVKYLPYPAKDFSGRVPQYVSALRVSDDGKKVYGQITDYAGSMIALITYTRNADNTWEYSVANSLLNPDNLQFPEWPGEGPQWVSAEDYMTPEEIEAYNEACMNWDYESGDPYPEYTDFMTDEEKAAFEAAYNAYLEAQEEYNAKFNAFMEVYYQVQDTGHSMMFNNLYTDKDFVNVYTTTTFLEEDPDSWFGFSETATPIIINANTLDYVVKTPAGVTVSGVAEDGTILGHIDGMFRQAAFYPAGTDAPLSLKEFFEQTKPSVVSWIEENMYHDTEQYNWDTGEFEIVPNCEFTGTPFATPDMAYVGCAVQNDWDYESPVGIYSYILPIKASGVQNIADEAAEMQLSVLKGGLVKVSADVTAICIYDLNGALLYKAVPQADTIETGLTSGAYIVKATGANGTKTLKALF